MKIIIKKGNWFKRWLSHYNLEKNLIVVHTTGSLRDLGVVLSHELEHYNNFNFNKGKEKGLRFFIKKLFGIYEITAISEEVKYLKALKKERKNEGNIKSNNSK